VRDYFLSRDTYVPPAAQIWRTAHLFRLPGDDFHNKKTGAADARALLNRARDIGYHRQ
jgi:hypothetical protein